MSHDICNLIYVLMDEVSVYFAYSEQDKIALSLARIDSKIMIARQRLEIRLQDKNLYIRIIWQIS